ncbi:hypothetical protein DPMN_160102 [Dreissena polymorpha]|uniref:Uncharacterized protein n=1 Tax=Dreissena polymorpha TaxID=45954 RepID=A0A9D4EQG5_DREPO|nr:hypothetical protein DPMN_160102 [Dreissena polymorpha]
MHQDFQEDQVLRQRIPAMNYMVGLGRIPSSAASVERISSTMNSLCTSSRSSIYQSLLGSLMRICTHETDSLYHEQLNSMVDKCSHENKGNKFVSGKLLIMMVFEL